MGSSAAKVNFGFFTGEMTVAVMSKGMFVAKLVFRTFARSAVFLIVVAA